MDSTHIWLNLGISFSTHVTSSQSFADTVEKENKASRKDTHYSGAKVVQLLIADTNKR